MGSMSKNVSFGNLYQTKDIAKRDLFDLEIAATFVSRLCKYVIKACKPKTEKEKIFDQKIKALAQNFLSNRSQRSSKRNLKVIFNENKDLVQPLKDGKYFYNNEKYKNMYWKLFFQNLFLLFPGTFKKPTNVDLNVFLKRDQPLAKSKNFNIQWIGHASFLIQVNTQNILIDPNYSSFVFPCFKRYTKVGIELEELPKIDTILITHNHVDHLDPETLKYFVIYQPNIICPLGLETYFKELGFKNVYSLNWFDAAESKQNQVRFTAVPAFHWSQPRFNLKGNESLWCGYVIEAGDKKLYHSGDTADADEVLDSINQKFKTLDYALIGVSPENEEDIHMGVDSFILASKKLKAKHIIPMHYLAFRMGSERIEDPYNDLIDALEINDFEMKISILKIGQIFSKNFQIFEKVS